jgi:hypothetical protein
MDNENENNNENNNAISLEEFNELKNQLANALTQNQEKDGIIAKVSGKKDELLGELKNTKTKLGSFQQMAQDEEEKGLFSQGEEGFKAVLDNRVKAATADKDNSIKLKNEELESSNGKIKALEDQIKKNEFSNKFLKVLPTTEIAETAYSDVIEAAMKNSEVINGEVVFRDSVGNARLNSKNEKFSELDFIETLRPRKHLFKVQQGNGNKINNGNSKVTEMKKTEIQKFMSSSKNTKQEKQDLQKKVLSNQITVI